MKKFIIALTVMIVFGIICGLLLGLVLALTGVPQWTIIVGSLIGGYFSSILFEKMMAQFNQYIDKNRESYYILDIQRKVSRMFSFIIKELVEFVSVTFFTIVGLIMILLFICWLAFLLFLTVYWLVGGMSFWLWAFIIWVTIYVLVKLSEKIF